MRGHHVALRTPELETATRWHVETLDFRVIAKCGDTVIAFFDAHGTARDGQPYDHTYAWFLTMRDEQIVEAFAFFDSIEFNDFWARVTPVASKNR